MSTTRLDLTDDELRTVHDAVAEYAIRARAEERNACHDIEDDDPVAQAATPTKRLAYWRDETKRATAVLDRIHTARANQQRS